MGYSAPSGKQADCCLSVSFLLFAHSFSQPVIYCSLCAHASKVHSYQLFSIKIAFKKIHSVLKGLTHTIINSNSCSSIGAELDSDICSHDILTHPSVYISKEVKNVNRSSRLNITNECKEEVARYLCLSLSHICNDSNLKRCYFNSSYLEWQRNEICSAQWSKLNMSDCSNHYFNNSNEYLGKFDNKSV